MPELTTKERLQPSLLDRLADDNPGQREESREQRVLSLSQLRASVLRDLSWLFNTTNLAALEDLEHFPEVARSVLNYGLPDLAGHTLSGMDVPRLEKLLRQAILLFEPRLLPRTVRVRMLEDPSDADRNSMSFAIEAELWAKPLPVPLYLRTAIDLEDGEVRVSERQQAAGD
jgi:type VI secretion system protein ImpF